MDKKTYIAPHREVRLLLFIGYLIVLLFAACVKGNDDSVPHTSNVMFYNAYNVADGVDFMINGSKLQTGTVWRDSSSSYNQVYSGTWDISAVTSSGSASNALASINGDLSPGKYYSCFFAGPSSSPELLLVPDNLSAPDSANRAKVRFFNLSASSGSVDMGVKDSTSLFSGYQYMKGGDYALIDTSAHKLVVKSSGSAGVVLASIDFHAASRRIYTFYLHDSLENKPVLSWKVYQR